MLEDFRLRLACLPRLPLAFLPQSPSKRDPRWWVRYVPLRSSGCTEPDACDACVTMVRSGVPDLRSPASRLRKTDNPTSFIRDDSSY